MNKKIKYAIYGGAIEGIGNCIYNAIQRSNQTDQNPNVKFDWPTLFRAVCKGMFLGSAGGYIIGAIEDHLNAREKPLNTDVLLFSIVNNLNKI